MRANTGERLHCGSMSCRRSLQVQWGYEVVQMMKDEGWTYQQHPGDDQAYWYCDRCKL